MKRYRLAKQRKAAGLSQEDLAEVLGVDRSTVVRWEGGERTPQPCLRPKLAKALGVSLAGLDELFVNVGLNLTPYRRSKSDPLFMVGCYG